MQVKSKKKTKVKIKTKDNPPSLKLWWTKKVKRQKAKVTVQKLKIRTDPKASPTKSNLQSSPKRGRRREANLVIASAFVVQ